MAELFRGAPEWQTYLRGANGKAKSRLWELNIGTPDQQVVAEETDAISAEPEIV
ncbi:hypothetical protein ACO0KV_07700 [Undibacterium sp. RuRC25W]